MDGVVRIDDRCLDDREGKWATRFGIENRDAEVEGTYGLHKGKGWKKNDKIGTLLRTGRS